MIERLAIIGRYKGKVGDLPQVSVGVMQERWYVV